MKRAAVLVSAAAAFALVALVADGVRAADPGELSVHNLASQAGQVMDGIRLTLKRHPNNGRVKELLTADQARVDDEGVVHVAGAIRLLAFDENGNTNSVAAGRDGFFDPRENYAECHGPVAFIRPGIVLTGTNLVWNSKINILRIETNAVLRIQRRGRSTVEALQHDD